MKEPTMTKDMWNNIKSMFRKENENVASSITNTALTNGTVQNYESGNITLSPANYGVITSDHTIPYNQYNQIYSDGLYNQQIVYDKHQQQLNDLLKLQKLDWEYHQGSFQPLPKVQDAYMPRHYELARLKNIFAITLDELNKYAIVFYMDEDSIAVMPSMPLFEKIYRDIEKFNIESIQEHLDWIVENKSYLVGLLSDYVSQATLKELITQYT